MASNRRNNMEVPALKLRDIKKVVKKIYNTNIYNQEYLKTLVYFRFLVQSSNQPQRLKIVLLSSPRRLGCQPWVSQNKRNKNSCPRDFYGNFFIEFYLFSLFFLFSFLPQIFVWDCGFSYWFTFPLWPFRIVLITRA